LLEPTAAGRFRGARQSAALAAAVLDRARATIEDAVDRMKTEAASRPIPM
jgi:hypothetical protein